jgi:nucleoside-diphosphate-sugar epimerase
MRALVTGGAGFIGSHIVDALINRGDEVICIDDQSAPQNNMFYWNDSAENIIDDIRDENLRKYYVDVDVVFHLAARSRIQPTVNKPSECFSVNVLGTQEVLEASRIAGVKRVVYSASSSYYGHASKPPFLEYAPKGCSTPYSLSKWQGEEVCDLYTKLYGLSTVSLRYFNVYGPREPLKGEYAPVMGLFKRQKKAGQPMTIVGDGKQRRDFTHINDVVEANLIAAEKINITGPINIGTGRNFTINELADMIGGDRIYVPERVGETRETLANNMRAREELGWSPKVDLEDYLNEKEAN